MKGIVGRLIIVSIVFTYVTSSFFQSLSASSAQPFDDIKTSFAKHEIIDLYNKNILNGTSETSFSPTRSMTRAEFITVLSRLLKLEPATSPVTPYTDVAQGAWYYGWIQAAVQLGLASGTSAVTFEPNKAVTRQEAAVLLARALKQSDSAAIAKTVFPDGIHIADWARESVAAVYSLGLMKGDETGKFRATDPITREEVAVMIARVLQKKNWAAELEAEPKERIVMGWQYGQTTAQYEKSILKSNVNTLSPRWYFFDQNGALTDVTDPALITWAKQNNKQIWAMVGNRSNKEATHDMLSSTKSRNAAVNQLSDIVSKYGLDGLNIDFENVAPGDRASLTTFITALAEKLHKQGSILSIDVSPDLGTDWTDAFDYAALGKQVDYVVMMGYDEHYGGSLYPGSNASMPYDERAVNTLLKVVPNQKIILALPFYTRDWALKKNGTVLSYEYLSLTEQNQLLKTNSLKPIWNDSLGQYVTSYTKQSVLHKIWLEEGRSLTAKYKLAIDKDLAGLAYWHIGGESSDLWTSIRNADRFYNYSF